MQTLRYEVRVTMTGKAIGKRDAGYSTFNNEVKEFRTLEEVKEYLREHYGNCRREKMYIDGKDGKTVHIGYIYSFRNEDISHPWNEDGTRNRWYQKDWVNIYEVKRKPLIVR